MAKGIRKVEFLFEDPTLTHFGGMFLFQRFCRKLDLKRLLQRHVPWERRDSPYHSAELVLSILYSMLAGLRRFSDTRILAYNSSFQKLLGLTHFPVPSTLRKFLKTVSYRELTGIMRLHDLLRAKMRTLPRPMTAVIFDMDSTVLPVFGWKIQGAEIGYNPRHRGRPSYHPMVCFEGHTQDTVHGMLRPGNTRPASAARSLWIECRRKIPAYVNRKTVQIRVRADSAFYEGKFIKLLDEERAGYVIVAVKRNPLKAQAINSRYETFRKSGKWEVTQFAYYSTEWRRTHLYVAVRQPKPEDQDEQRQPTLWEFKDYFYRVFIHNLPLSPASVFRFYKPRARIELDIRELKESFPLGKVPTNSFLANAIHFELTLFAYDLVNWFRRLCLPGRWRTATLYTIRTELLSLPARLIKIDNRNVLKFPARYVHQKAFEQTARRIDRLHVP